MKPDILTWRNPTRFMVAPRLPWSATSSGDWRAGRNTKVVYRVCLQKTHRAVERDAKRWHRHQRGCVFRLPDHVPRHAVILTNGMKRNVQTFRRDQLPDLAKPMNATELVAELRHEQRLPRVRQYGEEQGIPLFAWRQSW